MSKLKTVRKGYNRTRELAVSIPDFIPDKGNIFAVQGNLNSLNKPLTGPVVNADIGPSEANWLKYAKLAYRNDYGKENYTLNDYKKSTNWLGVSKEANPFSKANMSGGLKTMANTRLGAGLISGLTGVVGGLGKSLISDGLNSDVGNGIASFGSTVGGAIGLVNPLAGAAVSIGSNLVGGVFNRLFGMSVDQAKLKAANEGTAAYNNFVSNATNFSDISGPVAQANVQNAYRGGVFTSGEAAKLNQSLHKMRTDAKTFAERNVVNNVNNIANNQMNEALANYSADGGYINIGSSIDPTTAIGYALTLELIAGKDNKNNSNMTNLFAGMPSSMFAFGGNVQSNSANFSTGLSHINAGDSHELNTYGGVLVGVDNQGVPNLVEEGEVIYDDYVFSNRLRVPNYKKEYKKKQEAPYEAQVLWKYSDNTFADASKKIEKNTGSEERPEDNISQRGMDAELEVLRLVQEKEREKDKLQLMQEAIDEMTPEEFAMLLQQMQAGQEQQAQQEAAMQLQLMIPQGMEQMVPQEQMMSAYGGPIYALGGILNTPGNTYAYGGSFEDFTKELQRKGLTIKDYLNYLVRTNQISQSEADMYLTSDNNMSLLKDNFNKEYAENYLSSIKTEEKKVARIYKRKGVNPKKLTGISLLKYNDDVIKATLNPELLNADTEGQLFINKVNKGNIDSFREAAILDAKDTYRPELFLNLNGKLSIKYNDDNTIPQGLSFLNDGVTYNKEKGVWTNRAGQEVENPFTKEYGFTDVSRDWNSWGYIDKEGNWHSVDAPLPNTSGNTDYRFTPTAEWSKDLGKASDYEQTELYLNNYADFIEALNKGDLAALQRLYILGEATKSNNPKERRGKNRYFEDSADPKNLKKKDVIGYDPNDPIGNIFGNNYFTSDFGLEDVISKDRTYAYDKDGRLIRVGSEEWNSLSDEEKKEYTLIEGPLTRKHLMDNLKWTMNLYPENWESNTKDLYLLGVSDNIWGPHHLISNLGTKRFAHVDPQGNFLRDNDNNIRYINFDPNATYQYYNEGKPLEGQSLLINGVKVDTIGVLGGNVENHVGVRRNPDGTWRTYQLKPEDVAKLKLREILSTDKRYETLPLFELAVEGYNFTPHYYELDDDAYKSLGLNVENNDNVKKDSFPEASTWPYLAAGLALLGSLGYNLFSPTDYSNADAMINATLNASRPRLVSYNPIPYHIGYKPDDPWFYTSPITALANSTLRTISNKLSPSIGAETLLNSYNAMLALGKAAREASEHNFDKEYKVANYQTGVDEANSKGFLLADMANQDAASKASSLALEGLYKGYAMRQAIEDAKSKAINANIGGIANLLYNYGTARDLNALLKYGYDKVYGTDAKGGNLRRKKRGLSF